LLLNPIVFLKVGLCTLLRTEFSFFIIRSGLTVTGSARVYCTHYGRDTEFQMCQSKWYI
jgi:hypothetical protein